MTKSLTQLRLCDVGRQSLQKHCVHIQFMPHAASTGSGGLGGAAHPPLHQLINESAVHKEFRRFGNIVSVSLPRTPEMRLKGFAFVHYGESEAGEQSAAAAVSTMADGQINGMPVRVSYGKKQAAPRYRGRTVSGSYSGPAFGAGAPIGRARSSEEGLREERTAPIYPPATAAYSPALQASSPPIQSFGYVSSQPVHGRVPASPLSSPLASPLTMPMYPSAYYSLNPPLYLLTPSTSPAAYYPAQSSTEPVPLQLGEDGSVGWYAAAGAGGSISMRDQLAFHQMAALHQQQQQQQLFLARQQQQQQQQQQQHLQQHQHQQHQRRQSQHQLQMQQAGVDGEQHPVVSPGIG